MPWIQHVVLKSGVWALSDSEQSSCWIVFQPSLIQAKLGETWLGYRWGVKTVKPLLWSMELCTERTNMHKYLPRIVGPQFSCIWQTFQLNFQEILFLIDLHVSNLKSQHCFSQGEFRAWKLPSYVKLVILLYHEWLNLTPQGAKNNAVWLPCPINTEQMWKCVHYSKLCANWPRRNTNAEEEMAM